jgi:hypothetical protein
MKLGREGDRSAPACGQPVESYTTSFHRLTTTVLDNSSSCPQPFGQLLRTCPHPPAARGHRCNQEEKLPGENHEKRTTRTGPGTATTTSPEKLYLETPKKRITLPELRPDQITRALTVSDHAVQYLVAL